MKRFSVDKRVFELLPQYCVGIVVAKGIDNSRTNGAINQMLKEQTEYFARVHSEDNIKELRNIKAYREAFKAVGMNPNRYMCSIEALAKRVQKSAELPDINPIVNLGNAFSLKYHLTMGAHDTDNFEGDMEVRFSTAEDHFTGMGESEGEQMPEGEPVYVSGHTVKTRRWIWRQSEDGKITEKTSHAFFPIDGFEDVNKEQVLAARDELAELIKREFGCDVETGYVNREQKEFWCSL